MVEAIRWLLPVLGNPASLVEESHAPHDHLLVTKPETWRGLDVPEVLLSHHGEVAKWRRAQAEERTRSRRPGSAGLILTGPAPANAGISHGCGCVCCRGVGVHPVSPRVSLTVRRLRR